MSRPHPRPQFRAPSWRTVSALTAPLMAAPLLATGTAHAVPVFAAYTVPPPPTRVEAIRASVAQLAELGIEAIDE